MGKGYCRNGMRPSYYVVIGLLSVIPAVAFQPAERPVPSSEPGSVVARLDIGITTKGTLEAVLSMQIVGPARARYREALVPALGRPLPPQIFGSFLRDRRPRSTPVLRDSQGSLDVTLPIREDDFFPLIQRQLPLKLDLLPLAAEPSAQPDGKLGLGDRGIVGEEIMFEIPPGLEMQAAVQIDDDRDYAHYRSGTLAEGRKLLVFRELEIKQSVFDAGRRTSLDAFWKVIRADQQRTFYLRRVVRVDLTEWIRSVPPSQGNQFGLKAFEQREYEAGRQLFERAVQANPKHVYAWNNLGRALAALGRTEEARKAYETQIAINPRDVYAYNNLGLLLESEGKGDQAVDLLKKQLETSSGDKFATANLPGALMHAGKWDEVEQAAGKAAALQPTSIQQRVTIAVARVCLGKSADPRRELDAALGSRPAPTFLNNTGFYLEECNKDLELADLYISP